MPDSEKISLEILDDLFNKALGIHVLNSVPVTHTVERVVVDTKQAYVNLAASRNIRSQSQGSVDSATLKAIKTMKKNASQGSLINSGSFGASSPSKSINAKLNFISTP